MGFTVEYICKVHGKFEILFANSSSITPRCPCVYDSSGTSRPLTDPSICGRISEKSILGNLPTRIATDQGWEGGIWTPRGKFDSRKSYQEALAASGSLPREPGMEADAKRARQILDAIGMEKVKNRVASTAEKLKQGYRPFQAAIKPEDPLHYGFDNKELLKEQLPALQDKK